MIFAVRLRWQGKWHDHQDRWSCLPDLRLFRSGGRIWTCDLWVMSRGTKGRERTVVDGPGCWWTGCLHRSAARRSPQTASGVTVVVVRAVDIPLTAGPW